MINELAPEVGRIVNSPVYHLREFSTSGLGVVCFFSYVFAVLFTTIFIYDAFVNPEYVDFWSHVKIGVGLLYITVGGWF